MIALSSTKVEYKGVAIVACEVVWLKRLLFDLGIKAPSTIMIYCDNMSNVQLAKNHAFHAHTKHIEIHYQFIRECVLAGDIDLVHINTRQ